MHEGKHGILDDLDKMDDLFGVEDEDDKNKKKHKHDHDHHDEHKDE